MAAPLVSEGLSRASAEHQAARLAAHVYGTLGFRGNEKDYYDPRNSLLSNVVERRMGIPITLAIVYCEIARRAGIPAHGVGFQGTSWSGSSGRVAGRAALEPSSSIPSTAAARSTRPRSPA